MKKKALAFAAMACSVAMLLSACGGTESRMQEALHFRTSLLQVLKEEIQAAVPKEMLTLQAVQCLV